MGHKDIKTYPLYKIGIVGKSQIKGVLKNLEQSLFKQKKDTLTRKRNKEKEQIPAAKTDPSSASPVLSLPD